MLDPDDTKKLADLWMEAQSGYQEGLRRFWEDLLPSARPPAGGEGKTGHEGDAPAGGRGGAGREGDPAAGEAPPEDPWEGLNRLSRTTAELLGGFMGAAVDGLPSGLQESLDKRSFGQFSRPGASFAESWVKDLQDKQRDFVDAASRGPGAADPTRLRAVLEGMLAEYRRDLEALPKEAFRIDTGRLEAALAKVASGAEDPEARATVDRFTEVLAVKARYGAEYYADPDKVAVAPTPRTKVHEVEGIELFRYDRPEGADGPPVLIVYSVINRSYILDLVEDCSFVRHLLDRGLDVWMIEWGERTPGDAATLQRFIDPGLHGCVDFVREATGRDRVTLFGHCIGGTFAAIYAALHPERVERLLALTAPFRTPEEGVVAGLVDKELLDIDGVVDRWGHMPAKLIRWTFMGLKPYHELLKWKMFVENLHDARVMDRFAAIDRWANDNVDIPRDVFREFIQAVFLDEKLLAGEMAVHGERVDLGRIDCPLLSVVGEQDWIVPPDSGLVLNERVSSEDARSLVLPGSHLSLILDPRLRGRWDEAADFLLGEA